MSKDLDLVVYGAGGYTGMLVCQYILKVLMNGSEAKPKKDGQPVVQRWAIAGRRRAPLDAVMETLQKECNDNTALLPTVHVCSADELVDSPLTKDAKVLLSCAGPFATMGMHVLRACVKNKCHYVDVCGEPLFLRQAHAELHEEAKTNGVTAVVCSGFDCVPAETAVTALLDDVQPTLKEQPVHEVYINTYLQTTDGLSSGTMHTLLNSIISTPSGKKNKRDGTDKKKGSNQPLLPDGRKPSRPPTKPGFVPGIGWAIPFPTADPHVVRLSETLRREGQEGGVLVGPRVVYQHWLVTSGFFSWLCVILGGAMLLLSARYAPNLTKRFMGWKFPERTGPSREALDNGGTTLTGQAAVVEQGSQKKQTKKKTVVSQYRVVTPHVYMATAPYSVNAAIWLLEQRGASSAIQHGILTPSTALKDAGADGASMSPRYFELIGSDLQQSKL